VQCFDPFLLPVYGRHAGKPSVPAMVPLESRHVGDDPHSFGIRS